LSGCGQAEGRRGGNGATLQPGAAATSAIVKTKSGVEMILIPAGSFEMGSRRGRADEQPVHTVKLDAFLMDRYEVTQEQFAQLKFADPSHFKNPKNPVEQISWSQAALFCNARSKAEGLEPCYNEESGDCNFGASGYRLPTEAEWEYAGRAGSASDYFCGADPRQLGDYAWFKENSGRKTHPAGQRQPNPWGLYDMSGNVAEWCNDVYAKGCYQNSPADNPRGPEDGSKYVLRGGAWDSSAEALRSCARAGEDPGFQDACFARDAIGFRCVKIVGKVTGDQ
jgi:formylglycine-generating enzyme required for sulfatase activity